MNNNKTSAPVIIGTSFLEDTCAPASFVDTQNTPPIVRGTRKFWLDGSVVLNGACVLRTADLEVALPVIFQHWSVEQIANWWASSARNPGALYIEDSDEGWSACLPDPLGGAIAFSYQLAGNSFISTDTIRLVRTAFERGVSIEKDPLFQVERLILGNGGLTKSSYSGVESADPFQYLVMRGNQILVQSYDILDRLSDLSLHELFGVLRNDVLSAVHAISNSESDQVISHLTGGFDSRLVLAAILNQGLQDKVSIFCSGPEGSTDRIVADGLTRVFNLQRSNGAGLTAAPTQNMSERLMGALFTSGGVTNTGPIGREIAVSVSAMGGGYGEVLRTFFGGRQIANADGGIDQKSLVRSFMPLTHSGNSYISPEAVHIISNKLMDKFTGLLEEYRDPSFVGDAFYTHNRNRYHIGQTSLLWSRVGSRFDPLYSVAAFELSRRMTQTTRTANVLGHDLMDSFCPDLLSYPFDYDRYNPALLELRQRKQSRSWPASTSKIKFHDSPSPSVMDDSPFLKTLRRVTSTEPNLTSGERKQKLLEANKLGVNFWQVVYKETGQELLKNAFEETAGNAMHQFVDSKYIQTLFSEKDLNKKQLRDLFSLGGILSWISFG